MIRIVLFFVLVFIAHSVQAHKPSDSYLKIKVDGTQILGQWDIALRDLDFAIGLDADGDGEITWRELRTQHDEIAAYALARLSIAAGDVTCPTRINDHLVDHHSDGAYAVLRFASDCQAPNDAIEIAYSLFFDFDPQHKGLLQLQQGTITRTAIFASDAQRQRFEGAHSSPLRQFLDYGREGVWHIWIGFDHILFLLSLLLPAVVVSSSKGWLAVPSFRPAFWDVFKIVTAFTVAHSITLSLAAFGVIELPSRLVESAIALSVVLAALNNIFPVFQRRRWTVAFAFGLIHGFGFASVLADLGLPQEALLLALVGFNLGVELGQLAIVAVFLPTAFQLRHSMFYQRIVLLGGSIVIALVAATWLAERVFNLKIMPF